MAEPISWLAIQWLAQLVAQITVANGFHTDLGLADVITDRSQQIERNSALVLILAGSFTVNEDKSSAKTLSSSMDMTIEYCVPRVPGTSPELLAHRGRADLVRVFSTDLRGAPPGFADIAITDTQITSATEPGSNLVIAQVSARAVLSESRSPATT